MKAGKILKIFCKRARLILAVIGVLLIFAVSLVVFLKKNPSDRDLSSQDREPLKNTIESSGDDTLSEKETEDREVSEPLESIVESDSNNRNASDDTQENGAYVEPSTEIDEPECDNVSGLDASNEVIDDKDVEWDDFANIFGEIR